MDITALQNDILGANTSKEKIEKAAHQFEAFFVGYIYSQAAESAPIFEDEGGGGSIGFMGGFHSMMFQEMAGAAASSPQGFGLAEQILRQVNKYQEVEKKTQLPDGSSVKLSEGV